jgi:hypothetical protein
VEDEFVELRNLAGHDVPLFDPDHPTNTWRLNGLGFTFPTNVVLRSNALLLIVATNAADFRAKYAVPDSVLILGPSGGTLQDNGERLELKRPDVPDTNGVAYITVDEVRYDDKAPWPPGADGGGPSLQRKAPFVYGNDPANWEAAIPTPGADYIPGEPPIITGQPQSQTIVAYQPATFSVTAAGAGPLFYQWLFNGAPLSGATNATLQLPNVLPGFAGRYEAVVYNAAGSASSEGAQLVIRLPALILQQPRSVSTNAGRTVTFSVSAVGTGPLRYRWRLNGAPLVDATNATLALTNVQLGQAGLYTVVITDDIGPMLSAPARLEVLVEPAIVQQPLSQPVVLGSTLTLSVAVTNTATLPIGYRWRRNGGTISNAVYVLYQRESYLTITNVQLPFTNYTVVITNAARPSGITSAQAILSVVTDTDGDGLPDAWETAYGFSTNSPTDRTLDADGDGMLNWEEYVAGTDPTNALSYLKIDSLTAGAGATLTFWAISNKTYSLEYTDALETGAWSKLADVLARPTDREETLADPDFRTHRCYRLVTPRHP